MPIKTPPSNADSRLVQAFKKSAEGDGKITKKDVETLLEPLIKDGRGLSSREKATIKWAVEEFKMTGTGKQALSSAITDAAGAPVFEWQRNLAGPVSVQVGGALPKAQLDKKAAEAFAANTVSIGGDYDDEAMFAHAHSGNGGTHLYAMEGEKAETVLKFLAATSNQPELFNKVTTKTHAIYSVYESDDESHYGGVLVDKKTGKATAIEPFNIVDLPYDRAQFESIFGTVKDSNGRPVADDEFEENAWNVNMDEVLGGGKDVELPHFTAAQEARRDGPMNKAAITLREELKKDTTSSLVSYDYGVMSRTNDLDKQLANLAGHAQGSDYRDKEREGVKHKVLQSFDAFDDTARDAVVAAFKAGNPAMKDAKVTAFLDQLGNARDVQYAQVELPMTVRGASNRDKNISVVAHILVNVKDGDFLTVYNRARVPGDS